MGRIYNPDDFVIQYPGVYHGAAKEAMDKYFAMIHEINSTEITGADVAAGRFESLSPEEYMLIQSVREKLLKIRPRID